MTFLYNSFLFLWALCILPRTLYYYLFYGKYRGNLLYRLGLKLPKIHLSTGQKRIWIHATSLGETRAVGPFIDQVRSDYPEALIIFSSTTETGQEEAKKSHKAIDQCFFLPLDFSWIMKRLVFRIRPDLFILVESDFWPNLLKALKKAKAKIALINGKVSLQSFKRYKKAMWFSKRIFSSIDVYCVQSDEYKERFKSLGVPSYHIFVTGNLKFDVKEMLQKKDQWNFPKDRPVITVASTHEKEEEMIINSLSEIDSSIVFLLAPRHPERFSAVANWLTAKKIPFRKLREEEFSNERVVLVDALGVLDECFKRSRLAIIGGSFVSHIGGHNIYEPVKYQIPVIYGPYMQKQKALVEILEKYGIGQKVELSDLYNIVSHRLNETLQEKRFYELQTAVEGATIRSWEKIKEL